MKIFEHLTLRGVAFFGIFLHIATLLTLLDPDYFWHLRTGQYILAHGGLPAGDIYSYTHPDKPWVLHEWLFEVVLYGVHQGFGDTGVRCLVGGLVTGTLLVSYATAKKFLSNAYGAFAITLVLYALIKLGISPRPQLLTFLFVALTLRVLIGFKYFRESPHALWSLPVLMVIWVNAHAGYAIGLGVMGLFLITETVTYWLATERDKGQWHRLKLLAGVVALSVVASLINPYGYHHWLYPLQVMGMEAARSYIAEWHSPDFHEGISKVYLLVVLGYFMISAYRNKRPDMTELVLPAVVAGLGFVSVRHLPLAAVVLAPFMAMGMADMAPLQGRPGLLKEKILRAYRKFRGEDLGGKEYVLNAILAAVVAVGLPLYAPGQLAASQKEIEKMVPVKAVDFMLEHQIQCRMYATYHFGGYLIYKLYPDQKVFIDGRADMYGDDFMKEYIDISLGTANWQKLLESHNVNCVLLGLDIPLRQLLKASGDYVQIYQDENHALLVRRSPEFERLIKVE